MHNFCGRLTPNDSAKKARLLHGLNLTQFGLAGCIALLAAIAAAHPAQERRSETAPTVTDAASYEGQAVLSVELAGRPDLNTEEFKPLFAQQSGAPLSKEKLDASVAALKSVGRFQDVQIDVRPDQDGVRVLFVAQPAVYFGMYDFVGGGPFTYSRLLQASNYLPREPYSAIDLQHGESALQTFLRRQGYFESEVHSEVKTDASTGLANVIFHITLNHKADFGDVKIDGATPEEAAQLKSSLQSLWARVHLSAVRPGKDYSYKTLQNAAQYLEGDLRGRDHLAAQVRLTGAEYNPDTKRADITFHVQAGPVVGVRVEGARLWGWTKRRLLPVYDEQGLTPELIQEGRQNLISYFRSKGYFDVQVESETEQQQSRELLIYRVSKGPHRKIADVVFTGNDHLSADELQKHVSVEKAGFLTHGSYDESSVKTLRAAYQAAGFNQVKVTPQFTTRDGDIVVTFVIEEGPKDLVESFRVEGNETQSLSQLAPDGLRIAPGQPYAAKSIDDDRNKIMSHYLEQGYLTATFREAAEPLPDDPHRYRVVYSISEGPQVRSSNIVTLGLNHTQQELIDRETTALQSGRPLAERELLRSESRLYGRGVFDWAEVDARRRITDQDREDVIVKVHESRRNTITWGLGFESINRGGSVPTGTVALPNLPPVGLPSTFKTSQHTYAGPRGSIQYTRSNFRGKAESLSFSALYGPLIRRASAAYTNPTFRWTNWSSSFSLTGENNRENPTFDERLGVFGWQLRRPLDEKRTQNVFLRYSYTQSALSNLVIPELVPREDLHTRLSTVSVNYIRDTRDSLVDAHKGNYQSVQFDFSPSALGSSETFGKLLFQVSHFKDIHHGIVWANSVRLGLEEAFGQSHVPISEKFYTGGGSTLRGFPLNGAGPQRTIPACSDAADPSTCSLIRVPTGGRQLLILNTELRIPLPIKKGLSFVTFYDGGNVFDRIGFHQFGANYTNSAGIGARYATPVGPIRVDIGRNLNPISGIKATQIFITLGQAF
jgi:outer membrane protein insertion porin family